MKKRVSWDVAVIGAGAAGMMCAAQAGQRGRRVLLIEHYHVVGEKIRISGGGRCNFTNVNAGPANFLSQNPDFCRSALARYTPTQFVRLVESYGIAYHEKKLGQLFCDDSALEIIAMLKSECARGRVEWRMPCAVDSVTREGDRFVVETTPDGAPKDLYEVEFNKAPAAVLVAAAAPKPAASSKKTARTRKKGRATSKA